MRLLYSLLIISLFAIPSAHAKRIALVIGNDNYLNVTKLQKAVNDANAVAKTLRDLNFKVISKNDADRKGMNQLLGKAAGEIEAGDEVLFYFSGHGVSVNGQNYLLPVDIPPVNPSLLHTLRKDAFSEDEIINIIQERGAKVSILIIDACRNNPFPKEGARSVGRAVGLGRESSPAEGTFILYSAGKGQEALDRLSNEDNNPNSVFTRKLVPLLKKPGLSIAQIAKGLRIEVQDLAITAKPPYQNHKQFPSYYDEVRGDFYFIPGKVDQKAKLNPPQISADDALWQTIQNSNKKSDYEFYLSKFPKGKFAALASLKIKKLSVPKQLKKDFSKVVFGNAESSIILGNPDAPVTIVEYTSLSSPHAARHNKVVFPTLKAKYIDTGKVKYELREYPIDHMSMAGFQLGRCLNNSKDYFDLMTLLFRKQSAWLKPNDPVKGLADVAIEAGFTHKMIVGCIDNKKMFSKILAIKEKGQREFRVRAVPTFFINSTLVEGAQSLEEFEKIIGNLLD